MELTRDNLNALFFSVNGNFNKGFGQAWNGHEKFTMTTISSTLVEKYPITLLTGSMREWIGERVVNELTGKMVDVTNRHYERTEGIDRNMLEDDMYGYFAPMFTGIGLEAGNLWGRLATEALVTPGNWADDAAFFSSRKIGKATINNLVSGALTAAKYEEARARMMGFTAADGKTPLGLIPNLLIVGSTLESTAKRIFSTDLVNENGVAVGNIHKDEVEILLDPYLTTNDWYLACTNRGLNPVVVQKRKTGVLQRWDKESDDCVKNRRRYEYGIDHRGAAAAVIPYLIIKGAA